MRNKYIILSCISILTIFLFFYNKKLGDKDGNALMKFEEQIKDQIDKIISENINKQIDA